MPAAKKVKLDSKTSKREICGEKKVKEAINALKLLNRKFVEKELKKQPLLEDATENPIYLQLMLKKIPPPQLLRMIRVPLPHSLITETSEVCLITGDLEKRNHKAEVEPTVLHYKDLLRKHDVTKVAQVIPLRQLRTEYKTFESKRQLAAAYDVFLVDKKIAGVIPKTLGKSFIQARKFPIQIDMSRPNLKEQIDKALCQTEFSLTCRGNSYALEIARLSMEDDAILENIMTSIEVLGTKLPGNENNILSLYLKTAKSKAIPIYISLDVSGDILMKKPRKNKSLGIDELSTIDDAQVKVFRDGRVILRKMNKDSTDHEDDENKNLNESFSEDVLVENEEDIQDSTANEVSLKKKKKSLKNSRLIEIADNTELENEEVVLDSIADKTSSKKKKKGKKTADLDDTMENEEYTQNSIDDKKSPKKKAKKGTNLDQVTSCSQDESEEIQDSVTTEISSKKKKRRKDVVHYISDNIDMKTEEDSQNSSSNASLKKKKKRNSNHIDTDKALEDARETSMLVNSKKLKINENNNVSEKALKFKNKGKKDLECEDNGEIDKNRKPKMCVNYSEAEEDVNVKTPKSKKGKNKAKDDIDAMKKEISLISTENKQIMQNEKTPLRSKKLKKESTELFPTHLTSSVSKRKKKLI